MISEAEFRTLCIRHDLTHMYSDDGEVYRRGRESLMKIREIAKELSKEAVVRIWNEVVDMKVLEGYRDPFYWS